MKPPKAKTLDDLLMRHGSASALARKLGISNSYICEIRKGRRVPNLALALAIAKATGVPVESLAFKRPPAGGARS